MKFFVDTANLDQIKEAQDLGVLGWSNDQSIFDG